MVKIEWTPFVEADLAEKQATSLEQAAEKFREGASMLRAAANQFDKGYYTFDASREETSGILADTAPRWKDASNETKVSDAEKIVDNLASTVGIKEKAVKTTLESVKTFCAALDKQKEALSEVVELAERFNENLSERKQILKEVEEISLGDLNTLKEDADAVEHDRKVLKELRDK